MKANDLMLSTVTRRALPPGVTAEMPLIAVAWRALRGTLEKRAREQEKIDTEVGRLRDSLIAVAEQVHLLGQTLPAGTVNPARERLEFILRQLGISVLAPAGEPYGAVLMDVLENIAQSPDSHAVAPYVAEIVTPAILWDGALVRMGKAIIAVPSSQDAVAVPDEAQGG